MTLLPRAPEQPTPGASAIFTRQENKPTGARCGWKQQPRRPVGIGQGPGRTSGSREGWDPRTSQSTSHLGLKAQAFMPSYFWGEPAACELSRGNGYGNHDLPGHGDLAGNLPGLRGVGGHGDRVGHLHGILLGHVLGDLLGLRLIGGHGDRVGNLHGILLGHVLGDLLGLGLVSGHGDRVRHLHGGLLGHVLGDLLGCVSYVVTGTV